MKGVYGFYAPSPIHNLQITNTVSTPEIAFTGDTTADFILDPDNAEVLLAKILVVEVSSYHFSLDSQVPSLQHGPNFWHQQQGATLETHSVSTAEYFIFHSLSPLI